MRTVLPAKNFSNKKANLNIWRGESFCVRSRTLSKPHRGAAQVGLIVGIKQADALEATCSAARCHLLISEPRKKLLPISPTLFTKSGSSLCPDSRSINNPVASFQQHRTWKAVPFQEGVRRVRRSRFRAFKRHVHVASLALVVLRRFFRIGQTKVQSFFRLPPAGVEAVGTTGEQRDMRAEMFLPHIQGRDQRLTHTAKKK